MNSNRILKVAIWSPPLTSMPSETCRPRRFWPPGVAGLVGTLLIHTFVLQGVLLGARAHKVHPPEVQGLGATLIKSEAEPADTLILIELPTHVMASKPLMGDLSSAGAVAKNLMVTTISPDPLPHIEIPLDALDDDHDVAPIDSGDSAARAELFGRYTGQINARIERAWRRPRSPINSDSALLHHTRATQPSGATPADDIFRCQVRIMQDGRGSVEEVQLLNCNGTVAWQHSLVVAILESSPLPAPPNPTVFTRAVTMTFIGYPYGRGSAEDEYDVEPRQAARATESASGAVSGPEGNP